MPSDETSGVNLSELREPVAVLAFSGWSDAGQAASDALTHLIEVSNAKLAFEIDGEDYYDLQVNRPQVTRTPDGDVITWPTTEVRVGRLQERDLVLVSGPEPSMRMRTYANQLVSALRSARPQLVVSLGALLADNPHTRPVPVSRSTTSSRLREQFGLSAPTYEGPTGVTGVVSAAATAAGLDVVSLWAAIPHYVGQPPHPRATVALLERLEDLSGLTIDLGDLPETVRAWQRGVSELIEDDPELASYVATLEEDQDESDLPEASGDAIAAEFERYLRRRGDS